MRMQWTTVGALVLAAAATGCATGVEGPDPVRGGAQIDEMYPTGELDWDDSAGIHNGKNPSEAAAGIGAFLPRTHNGQPPENLFLIWDSMRVTVVGDAIR